MKLTIFAATGGIGRQALEQAVASGHDVTAAVRNPKNVSRPARVVPVDLAAPDPLALQAAVRGADAVISGLGARSASDIGIAWRGTQSIIEAMRAEGVRRLVVVSAAPIGAVPTPAHPYPPKYDPGDGFFMRHLFGPFARAAFRTRYADLAHMEELVRESGLDWTIVRPPRLTDKRLSGRYRTAYGRNIKGGFLVSRADVAQFMLSALERRETIRQIVGIAA